ncbi:MAG: cytochrome C oxidase subunit IV family protein [Bdellovibrionota bacterium]
MSEAHAQSTEDIKKSIRVYMAVFGSLMVLTVLTVAVAYFHFLTGPMAIFVGLTIAVVKASLVALYFMHLIHEEKTIYRVLVLTFFFFAVCLFVPVITDLNAQAGHHVP